MSLSLWKIGCLKTFYFKISSKNFKMFSKDIQKILMANSLQNRLWEINVGLEISSVFYFNLFILIGG